MRSEAEAELVARCRRGEGDAWDCLFDLHYDAAYRFIFQIGPEFSEEDVEEICQEAFLAVIRSIHLFHGHSQFQTWLFRIAGNKARDYRQKLRAAKRGGGRATLSLQAADPDTGLTLDPATDGLTPDEALLSKEQMLMLRGALDGIGEPCREIIELRYFGDLSYDEISIVLKLNAKTVSSRLSKCLARLEFQAQSILNQGKTKPFSV